MTILATATEDGKRYVLAVGSGSEGETTTPLVSRVRLSW